MAISRDNKLWLLTDRAIKIARYGFARYQATYRCRPTRTTQGSSWSSVTIKVVKTDWYVWLFRGNRHLQRNRHQLIGWSIGLRRSSEDEVMPARYWIRLQKHIQHYNLQVASLAKAWQLEADVKSIGRPTRSRQLVAQVVSQLLSHYTTQSTRLAAICTDFWTSKPKLLLKFNLINTSNVAIIAAI